MFVATSEIVEWLSEYRYFALLPLAVAERPIVTIIAGYLSSVGRLSLLVVLPVVIVGDLVGDSLLYFTGRWGWRQVGAALGTLLRVNEPALGDARGALRKPCSQDPDIWKDDARRRSRVTRRGWNRTCTLSKDPLDQPPCDHPQVAGLTVGWLLFRASLSADERVHRVCFDSSDESRSCPARDLPRLAENPTTPQRSFMSQATGAPTQLITERFPETSLPVSAPNLSRKRDAGFLFPSRIS